MQSGWMNLDFKKLLLWVYDDFLELLHILWRVLIEKLKIIMHKGSEDFINQVSNKLYYFVI